VSVEEKQEPEAAPMKVLTTIIAEEILSFHSHSLSLLEEHDSYFTSECRERQLLCTT
jgi:hypothetical protein